MSSSKEAFAFRTAPAAVDAVHERLVDEIETAVEGAGAEGCVVAMSGGIDSTVSAALAREALGPDRVLGLGLPCNKTDAPHANDARTIAEGLGIDYREVHLRPLVDLFEATVADELEPTGAASPWPRPGLEEEAEEGNDAANRALGNATARMRMICAYYAANRSGRLVLGTANRSELLLGYFTKYGDGGADLFPLGDLYKTEVRAMAKRLGIPRRIVGKEPTAGFVAGRTDADELGATYDVIDPLLRRTIDRDEPLEAAVADLDIDRERARGILETCAETAHKRAVPPTPGIGDRPNAA